MAVDATVMDHLVVLAFCLLPAAMLLALLLIVHMDIARDG